MVAVDRDRILRTVRLVDSGGTQRRSRDAAGRSIPLATGRIDDMTDTDIITIELEIDVGDDGPLRIQPGVPWRSAEDTEAIVVELAETEVGHGFGLSEALTIVVSVGVGTSSQLVADAIRTAIGKVIRRSKTRSRQTDGSREGLTKLIEDERLRTRQGT